MSSTTTCYVCGSVTPLRCMNPNCSHYFCSQHGDFICHDCHQQSHQQQMVAVQQQEQRAKITNGIVGVLIAIVIGVFTFTFTIIKEILRHAFD